MKYDKIQWSLGYGEPVKNANKKSLFYEWTLLNYKDIYEYSINEEHAVKVRDGKFIRKKIPKLTVEVTKFNSLIDSLGLSTSKKKLVDKIIILASHKILCELSARKNENKDEIKRQ